MKKKIFAIFIALASVFAFTFVSCNDDEENSSGNTILVKGKVDANLSQCEGNLVLIDVENVENIGSTGLYNRLDGNSITYKNAIGVPIDSSTATWEKGDEVTFECRAKTSADDYLFRIDQPCNTMIEPIVVPCYVILNIFKN